MTLVIGVAGVLALMVGRTVLTQEYWFVARTVGTAIIRRAVHRLPEASRVTTREEWLAELDEFCRARQGAILYALGTFRAARRMRAGVGVVASPPTVVGLPPEAFFFIAVFFSPILLAVSYVLAVLTHSAAAFVYVATAVGTVSALLGVMRSIKERCRTRQAWRAYRKSLCLQGGELRMIRRDWMNRTYSSSWFADERELTFAWDDEIESTPPSVQLP